MNYLFKKKKKHQPTAANNIHTQSTQVFKDISPLQYWLPSHVPSSLIQIFLLTSQGSSFHLYSREEPQTPFNGYLHTLTL